MFAGIDGVQHHKPRIIHAAIRISKARRKMLLERCTLLGPPQIDAAGAVQALAWSEPIVKEETSLDHESGAQSLVVRQDETRRPDEVRRDAKQGFPLSQGLPNEAKLVIFKITQAAMNELARRRRRRAGKIALLAEHRLQAASGCIARDPGSIDAAADDEEIDVCFRFHQKAKGMQMRPCQPLTREFIGQKYQIFARSHASQGRKTFEGLRTQTLKSDKNVSRETFLSGWREKPYIAGQDSPIPIPSTSKPKPKDPA
jgi:hypothetical protein